MQLLHSELLRVGFIQCVTDSCHYYQGDRGGMTFIGVYVDDLLATVPVHQRRLEGIFVLLATLETKDLVFVSKVLA